MRITETLTYMYVKRIDCIPGTQTPTIEYQIQDFIVIPELTNEIVILEPVVESAEAFNPVKKYSLDSAVTFQLWITTDDQSTKYLNITKKKARFTTNAGNFLIIHIQSCLIFRMFRRLKTTQLDDCNREDFSSTLNCYSLHIESIIYSCPPVEYDALI